jgi:hypothetical protein
LPSSQLIPSNTTLIVIVNGEVGSAGEGFIMRLSRLENVVVVGENSSGTLTFGNVSFHQLPHSKLLVSLPININIFMDLEFREERGIFPDLWVPAADALNNAVAAARRGLIAARIAPPEGYFSVEFVPERPPRRRWFREHEELLPIALMLLSGSVFIYVFRRQKPFFLFYGSSWLTIGVIFVLKGASEGYFLIPYGVVFLAIGVWKRWNPKAASETISNT